MAELAYTMIGGGGVPSEFDAVISAIDSLFNFVSKHSGDLLDPAFLLTDSEFAEFMRLDAALAAHCRVAGLKLEPFDQQKMCQFEPFGFSRLLVERNGSVHIGGGGPVYYGAQLWPTTQWQHSLLTLKTTAQMLRDREAADPKSALRTACRTFLDADSNVRWNGPMRPVYETWKAMNNAAASAGAPSALVEAVHFQDEFRSGLVWAAPGERAKLRGAASELIRWCDGPQVHAPAPRSASSVAGGSESVEPPATAEVTRGTHAIHAAPPAGTDGRFPRLGPLIEALRNYESARAENERRARNYMDAGNIHGAIFCSTASPPLQLDDKQLPGIDRFQAAVEAEFGPFSHETVIRARGLICRRANLGISAANALSLPEATAWLARSGQEDASARREDGIRPDTATPNDPTPCLTIGAAAGPAISDDAQGREAVELWSRDPIACLTRLRDRCTEGLGLVINAHELAVAAAEGATLADACCEFANDLTAALSEAQAFWHFTPVAELMARRGGEVYLDLMGSGHDRLNGCCYHDLALKIMSGVLAGIEAGQTAREYAQRMRYLAAVGGHVGQRLSNIVSSIWSEWQTAMRRWRRQQSPAPLRPQPENSTRTNDRKASRDASNPVLTLANWSELAIGIDERQRYWAIQHAPGVGEKFPKSKALSVRLAGKRWKALLNLAARSADGRTVHLADLLRDWGLAPRLRAWRKTHGRRPAKSSAPRWRIKHCHERPQKSSESSSSTSGTCGESFAPRYKGRRRRNPASSFG